MLAPGRTALPWTSSDLAEAKLAAVASTGWFESEEPGPSNRNVFEKFLKECLVHLEETAQEIEFAKSCEQEFGNLRNQIEQNLAKLAWARPPFQTSAYDLESYSTKSFNVATAFEILKNSENPENPHGTDNQFFLRVIEESQWLEHAKSRIPEVRLGSNLFFQQQVSGLSLLDKNLRAYLALVDSTTQQEVAWAQIIVLKNPPLGRLRIRGVTTRPGCDRKGFASKLLTMITSHLRSVARSHLEGFTSIDVYAAPEAIIPFRRAGFTDDVSRVTRSEETVDAVTGQLVATDRELTPLTFPLGET